MKIAIYCTADDNFVKYAIVALKSIQRFHDYDLFVLSGKLKKENISLLESYNIKYIYSDKHEIFPSIKIWPNIAFLLIFGPEIFHDLGYDYSLGIDADVFCDKSLAIEKIFRETKGYAGIVNQGPRKENFKNVEYIKNKYNLSEKDLEGYNTNAGIIFWNNKAMKKFKLSEKFLEVWEDNLFVSVGQSIFALISIPLHFNILPRGYNYRLGNKLDLSSGTTDIKMYHYTGKKPWEGKTLHGDKWLKFKDEFAKNI